MLCRPNVLLKTASISTKTGQYFGTCPLHRELQYVLVNDLFDGGTTNRPPTPPQVRLQDETGGSPHPSAIYTQENSSPTMEVNVLPRKWILSPTDVEACLHTNNLHAVGRWIHVIM